MTGTTSSASRRPSASRGLSRLCVAISFCSPTCRRSAPSSTPSASAEPMSGGVLSERDVAVLRSFARRIDPADAGAHNNLGVLYYQKGLVEDAIAAFTRALELDPKMQVAQRNLEIAYHDTGYYDRRVAQLQERLRQAADDRDARWE